MDNFSLVCSLCEQKYNEDCLPRILKCGHSVCSACVNNHLTNHIFCPECRKNHDITIPNNKPVNYPLAWFIRSNPSGQIKFPNTPLPFMGEIVDEDLVKGIGNCPGHSGVITSLCVSCSMWVCLDCLVIEHRTSPRGSCKILSIRDAMKQIKLEHQNRTDKLRGKVKSLNRKLEEEESKIPKLCCLKKNIYHRYLIAKINKKLKELKNEDELVSNDFLDQLDQVSGRRDKAFSVLDLMTSCEELLKCQDDFEKYTNEEDKRKESYQKDLLQHLRVDLQHLVRESKKPLYISYQEGGKSKWAPIIPRNKGLLVYSLRDGTPPEDGILLPFPYVRDLVYQDPMVFLEVTVAGQPKGISYVQLYSDSILCHQTVELFLGKNGHCYKNTNFYAFNYGILHGGDFVNNNGTGWVDRGFWGINENDRRRIKSTYGHRVLKVNSNSMCGLFFYLEQSMRRHFCPVGIVVQGFNVLKAVSRVNPIEQSSISECGLFCPLKYCAV